MYVATDVIVLSDLHLASNSGSSQFRADEELAGFLTRTVAESRAPLTVVIAGDMLDYIGMGHGEDQLRDGDVAGSIEEGVDKTPPLDPARAVENTTTIINAHPDVFDALAAVARSPQHRLAIAGGNHDPELALPSVRRRIEERLSSGACTPNVLWFVHGEAAVFNIGDVAVLIEHGDLHDDWNRIDHDALRGAISLITRGLGSEHDYREPPGTRLVRKHIAPLRKDYAWVDLLQPVRRAVFPILAAIMTSSQKVAMLRAVDELAEAITCSILREIRRRRRPSRNYRAPERKVAPMLTGAAPDAGGPVDPEAVLRICEAQTQAIRSWVRESLDEATVRGAAGRRSDRKLIRKLRKVAAEDGFFEVAVPDPAVPEVDLLIEEGADLVLHGHTHGAKAYQIGHGLYMNAGTWGHMLQLPDSEAEDGEWQGFLQSLRDNSAAGFLRPTFIRVTASPGGSGPVARLIEWGRQDPLARWSFDRENRCWTCED